MHFTDFPQLLGRVWSAMFPRKEFPPLPDRQPRDHAIDALFDYLSLVEWRYTGEGGRTNGFTVPREQMFDDRPDDATGGKLPSFVIAAQKGSHQDQAPPLGPPVVFENTYDGDTVLVEIGTYIEVFRLEVWTASSVTRRAILAGLDLVMSPTGDQYGLELELPNYHGAVAWFGLNSTTRIENELVNRRRMAECEIELWVPVLQRVPAGLLTPRLIVEVE